MSGKTTVRTDGAPEPIGPYSQAVVHGELVFCSGQIGIDPASGEVVPGGSAKEAERALMNLNAVLTAAGSGFEDVVEVTMFLRNMADFAAVNEVYARHLKNNPPARSTVAVAGLPKNALVEIDAIAMVRRHSP